jgi:hypothetical protein
MTARVAAFLFAGALIALPASAQPTQQPTTYGPSALADHATRIEHHAAEDLKTDPGGFGWSVDLDLYISKNKAEFEALGKYIILVFATFSNDRGELPLARVYSGGAPIKCLAPVWRDVPPQSATAKAYGKFRSDSLCVLPIDLARQNNIIAVDFARNRKSLVVSSYPVGDLDFVKTDQNPRPLPSPDPMVLKRIIAREYPGFGFQVRP